MPESPRGKSLEFPPFHLRTDVDLLYRGEDVVPLEPQAVKVLRYLVQNHDRVVPKRELHDAVWADTFTSDSVLKKAVYQARRALREGTRGNPIRTFHARGYQFVGAVQPSVAAPAIPTPSLEVAQDARRPDYDQLVGRDSELTALRHELAAVIERQGRPVLLTGMAGIGKSQLARHFIRHARAAGALCLEARFFDYPASTLAPFETFTDLLRNALHVESRDAEVLRATVRERLGATLPRELGASTQGGASRSAGGEIFRAVVPIADCFVRLSRENPVVLVLDDLQWADAASLEVIGYLMRTAPLERLMIVGLVRADEGDSAIRGWLERQGRYRTSTTIALGPLGTAALRDCMVNVFGGESTAPEIPGAELEKIVAASGGNPYFFTEMLRVLTAGGAIAWTESPVRRWTWTGTGEVRLPESLVMAARDRLGRLSPEVLALIEEASVIGDEFRLITLATMSGREPAEVERLCAQASACGVLVDTQLSPTEDRRFPHAILRRVVYDGVPYHRRRELHERAAAALESVYASDLSRVAGVIAGHYERAGRAAETCAWSIRAARVAASRWEWSEVVADLERARGSIWGDPGRSVDLDQQMRLDLELGEAYLCLGRLRDAERLLSASAGLAESRGRHPELATALLKLGQTRIGLSAYQEALAATERSHELYVATGDADGTQRSLVQAGTIRVAMGSYDAAVPAMESVLASAAEESEVAALARGILGWARALQGRWDEAVPLLQRAIRDADRLGDARRRAVLLRHLHWVELARGEFEQAVALAFSAREAARSVGDAAAEAKSNMALGQARTAQGLWKEGVDFLQRTIDSLVTIGDRHCEAEALWLLGCARLETGEIDDARRNLARALRLIREIGDRDDEFRILTDLADCRRVEGDLVEAAERCAEAGRIAAELGNETGVAVASLQRARVALDAGDADLAEELAAVAAATLDHRGSGESWRAWWVLGEARAKAEKLDAALDALTRTVALLDRIRDQIDPADQARRDAVTAARRPQAGALATLLRQMGRVTEAAGIAQAWSLDGIRSAPLPFARRGPKRSIGR